MDRGELVSDEIMLGLIEERIDRQLTPAVWQRKTVSDAGDIPRQTALRDLVEAYLEKANTRRPVTEW